MSEMRPTGKSNLVEWLCCVDFYKAWSRDGSSLLPLLEDKSALEREFLTWHYPHYHGSFKDCVLFATSEDANYDITGLSENTEYSISISAKDDAGNLSDTSTPLKVTTSVANYSSVLTINSTSIYPNPATDMFFVETSARKALITIKDLNGNTVYQNEINKRIKISTEKMGHGLYIISIENKDKGCNFELIVN